jgi:elongation factor G
VKGKDGVGAKMDSMDLERERGITIQSAATHCFVEGLPHQHHRHARPRRLHDRGRARAARARRRDPRAVRRRRRAVAVAHGRPPDAPLQRPAPRFVNKCDRAGANPLRACDQLREKLHLNPVLMQLPIGLEDKFEGVVDLITMKAYYFEGDNGEKIIEEGHPGRHGRRGDRRPRDEMLDALSTLDELTEAMLEEKSSPRI